MAIQAQFVTEPPSTITGPFQFTVSVTNTGAVGDDYAFEAVLINPATGEQAARIWSTNVWMPAGETKELTFYLQETRELDVEDGTYDLNLLYGVYPSPTNWKSAINTTVSVALSGGGGGGGGGDTDPTDGGGGGDGGGGTDKTIWDRISENPAPFVGGAVLLAGASMVAGSEKGESRNRRNGSR